MSRECGTASPSGNPRPIESPAAARTWLRPGTGALPPSLELWRTSRGQCPNAPGQNGRIRALPRSAAVLGGGFAHRPRCVFVVLKPTRVAAGTPPQPAGEDARATPAPPAGREILGFNRFAPRGGRKPGFGGRAERTARAAAINLNC
jgi:hypothetical protein